MGEQVLEILTQASQVLSMRLFDLGPVTITPMSLVKATAILVIAWLFSRVTTRFLRSKVMDRANISLGIQASISRILHYIIMLIGGFITLQNLGVDLTALAAVSAVAMVGIGFGLQNIASNFISGLIMLFERPIQVGDFVEVKGVLGTVNAINARSTTVDSIDNVSIIVPNSDFISSSVTNWSHKDARTRIHVKVGVAYSSDVDLVRETLLQVAKEHAEVIEHPAPTVQFVSFGDSALNFTLLIWLADPKRQFFVRSDLNFAIVHAFREKGIQIPFPQRDLHIRSADVPIETKET